MAGLTPVTDSDFILVQPHCYTQHSLITKQAGEKTGSIQAPLSE